MDVNLSTLVSLLTDRARVAGVNAFAAKAGLTLPISDYNLTWLARTNKLLPTLGSAWLLEGRPCLEHEVNAHQRRAESYAALREEVARGDPKLKSAATLTSGLLIVATLSLLLYSAVHLVHNWASLNKPDLVDEFILPIWLTAAAVPVLYAFAFYMGYQQLFRRLSVSNDFHQPTMRARWGVMLELRGKLVDVDQFRGGAARDAAQAGTVREAREAVRRFRAERAAEANARATARQLLIDRAGQQGLDDEGLVLDRREFATTKSALRWLATCQMGWYRNQDRPDEYRPDLLDILTDSKQLQLESDEPIHMKVRKDRQAWYAYRRTPSGHVFGIGARGAPPSQWFYDADVPPSGYPSNSATGWTGYLAPERPEWRDEPAT